jgi:hypothetical protein
MSRHQHLGIALGTYLLGHSALLDQDIVVFETVRFVLRKVRITNSQRLERGDPALAEERDEGGTEDGHAVRRRSERGEAEHQAGNGEYELSDVFRKVTRKL